MNPDPSTRELQTWQEIAAYLGVSVRSAQEYEKNAGLPVHRLPGKKARVWAIPGELDAWKNRETVPELERAAEPRPELLPEPPPRRRRHWVGIAAGIIVLMLGITGALWSYHLYHRVPARIEVHGHVLTVSDNEGSPIWRYTFPENIADNQINHPSEGQRHFLFADIDGDGQVELLFAYATFEVTKPGSALYCFSSAGRVKWKYSPGRVISDQRSEVAAIYNVTSVEFVTASWRGPAWIAVNATHGWSYADVVAVLNVHGVVQGEYYHSGHLYQMELSDLDGDGRPEIILGGLAEGRECATLVVLDPHRVLGASTQPPGDRHQFRGMATGAEKAIVYFPRTLMNAKLWEHNLIYKLTVSPDRILAFVSEDETVLNCPYIVYELSRNLELRNMLVSDGFINRHRTLEAQHLLNHKYSKDTCIPLKEFRVVRPLPSA